MAAMTSCENTLRHRKRVRKTVPVPVRYLTINKFQKKGEFDRPGERSPE